MSRTVVLSYARTPFGAFLGRLSLLTAPQLGTLALQAALRRSGVGPAEVSEVILGCVLTAGVGQAPARQAALGARLPDAVPCMTVNKVCGSGMKAILLADQAIRLGESRIIAAGGMESMSQAPYLLQKGRSGYRLGNGELIDSMIYDGLWDPYSNQHMGMCGELCARERGITREEQDAFAIESYRRAQWAQEAGKFASEVCSVEVAIGRGKTEWIDADEGPARVIWEKIPLLTPSFQKEGGTITAANSSTINDGAAVLTLASEEEAARRRATPLAAIVATAQSSQAPEWFTTAPERAVRLVAEKAGWQLEEVDLFEINEAFAVVALANQRSLGIPLDRLNVWGGAIAMGHPIGATGARIAMTLIAALRDRGLKRGIAALCIGGGEATALAIETL